MFSVNSWKPDMEEEDAKQLVREAIRAGIFNDMGSGSYVDLVVIKANDNVRERQYHIPSGIHQTHDIRFVRSNI